MFRRIVPRLLKHVHFSKESPRDQQYHVIHSIMILAVHSPRSVVRAELGNLLPVIVLALTSDALFYRFLLPAVVMLLENNDVESLVPHADSCVKNLLRLCLHNSP